MLQHTLNHCYCWQPHDAIADRDFRAACKMQTK